MRSLGRPRAPISEEENPYWVSFSDLMSGLLIIFILAAVALIIELTQKSEKWDEVLAQVKAAEDARDELIDSIVEELEAEGIRVIINGVGVVTIPESSLKFRSGSAEIPPDNGTQRVINRIGEVLFDRLYDDPRADFLDTIFVEGHTDCTTYRGLQFDDNWDLATTRSNNVWRYWSALKFDLAPFSMSALENKNNKPLFSVSGYGETRPLPNTRPDGFCDGRRLELLAQNRRIDLRFTVIRPSLDEYEEFLKLQ
ncbi:OmpA family protein [Luminiphilus sp.]|jgi:flagellar motor protein MotB|nr:OmpA family protein [Luminiphilus sp.]